jgi:hypothetical protein
MDDIAWMNDEFFDQVSEFMRIQREIRNTDDYDENELYRIFENAFADIDNRFLYESKMTPAQFCWRFLEEKANKAMERTRFMRDGGARKVLIAIRAVEAKDNTLCLEYHGRLMRALNIAMDYDNLGYDPVFMTVGYRLGDGIVSDAAADFLRERGAKRIAHKYDVGPGLGEDWLACAEFAVDKFYDDIIIVCSPEEYACSYFSCVLKNIIPKHELVAYRENGARTTLAVKNFTELFEEGPLATHKRIAAAFYS